MKHTQPSSPPPGIARDQRGALLLEYIVITAVGLIVAVALGGFGVAMVRAFGASIQILYSEFP